MVSVVEPDNAPKASAGSVCHGAPFFVITQELTLLALHDMVIASPAFTTPDDVFIEAVGGIGVHAPPVQL